MGDEPDDEFFDSIPDQDAPTPEELAVWLAEYMTQSQRAHGLFRENLCTMVVDKLFNDFGVEGMCELMVAIDKRAGWISDILIEDADIHDVMFTTYNTYDDDAIMKARMSDNMVELNKKIWRLRKKYAKLIALEIMAGKKPEKSAEPTSADDQ
jgi:hypothetical protein